MVKKHASVRGKRSKNGTVQWRVTVFNSATGKQMTSRVRATYDEITMMVHRKRSRSRDVSVCAEEMNRMGTKVLENGRVVSLDSLNDEAMIASVRMNFLAESNQKDDYLYGDVA